MSRTLKVSIVTRLDLGDGVTDRLTDHVQVLLVQQLLRLDMAPHSIPGLIEVVEVLQVPQLLTEYFKLFKTTLQQYKVALKALKSRI